MSLTVNEAHSYQLKMALEVKRICEKYNIVYFLDAGTLLGAVREKGFIPWDDDIDIGFTRVEYERFINVAKKELPQPIYLQKWDEEESYGYPYAKLRYLGTDYRLATDGKSRATDGVFLDLLPYDSVPNNCLLRTFHRLRLRFLYLIIQTKLKYSPEISSKSFGFFIQFLCRFYKLDNVKKKYLKTVTKYNSISNLEYVTEADGIDYNRFILPKCFISATESILFENHLFSVPLEYDGYLTSVYGDYMKRPEESERVGKHGVL